MPTTRQMPPDTRRSTETVNMHAAHSLADGCGGNPDSAGRAYSDQLLRLADASLTEAGRTSSDLVVRQVCGN